MATQVTCAEGECVCLHRVSSPLSVSRRDRGRSPVGGVQHAVGGPPADHGWQVLRERQVPGCVVDVDRALKGADAGAAQLSREGGAHTDDHLMVSAIRACEAGVRRRSIRIGCG